MKSKKAKKIEPIMENKKEAKESINDSVKKNENNLIKSNDKTTIVILIIILIILSLGILWLLFNNILR
jgi:hypothetical protein